MKALELEGQTFGRLTAMKLVRRGKRRKWECRCTCGKTTTVAPAQLTTKRTQSCGCLRTETNRHRPFEALYRVMCGHAKRRNIPMFLTYEDFLTFTEQQRCHYCLADLTWTEYNGTGRYNLDRKDTTQGYIVENVVPCCQRCNKGKCDSFSYQEWYAMTAMFRNKGA